MREIKIPATGGVVSLNKPSGVTSFSMVRTLRELTGIKRVGHIGTLDPFAAGVLPLCLGRGCAGAAYMDYYDKIYRVTICFGAKTDTLDVDGKVIKTKKFSPEEIRYLKDTDYKIIRDAIKTFEGEIWQIPPMYSAVKIEGKPLYKYARDGKEITREKRKVYIYSIKILQLGFVNDVLQGVMEVHCSKGTYIRTICDDLGENLGFFAYAKELTRLQTGPFHIYDSISPDDLEKIFAKDNMEYDLSDKKQWRSIKGLYNTDYALSHIPKIAFPNDIALDIIHGKKAAENKYPDLFTGKDVNTGYSLYTYDGKWIGIIKLHQDSKTSIKYFKAERIFTDENEFVKK